MKQRPQNKHHYFLSLKTITALMIALAIFGVVNSGFKNNVNSSTIYVKSENVNKDSIESVKAFNSVYKVLMSPRCMNCHPSGDSPLQGDDSHVHTMFPKRGGDGKGVYAMKCANCHQPSNTPGEHTPPGDPNWHLPPADMKMVFQGRTPRQLAKQLMDPNQNGHKSKEQLIAHVTDALVVSAWHPGEGRTLPPMTHDAFSKAWITWIQKGAYAPK